MKPYLFLIFVCFVAFCEGNCAPLITNGFAHNDYEHTRPLLDALQLGFCAVEADVYLVNGQLLVGHDADKLSPERTLASLYLDPLAKRVRQNGGTVYAHPSEFLLLIDIKSEAESTYQALKPLLTNYVAMLTRFSGQTMESNAISIVLSGNRPINTVSNETRRWVAIDGRVSDLAGNPSIGLMPLVSDIWTRFSRWNGKGTIPEPDRQRLQEVVARAHAQKRKIRLWAAPDTPQAWSLQQQLGIDLINTDKLSEFSRHITRRPQK